AGRALVAAGVEVEVRYLDRRQAPGAVVLGHQHVAPDAAALHRGALHFIAAALLRRKDAHAGERRSGRVGHALQVALAAERDGERCRLAAADDGRDDLGVVLELAARPGD